MTRLSVFVRVVVFHLLVLAAIVLIPMLKGCEWFPKKEQIITVDLASLPPLPPEQMEEDDPEETTDEDVISEATPVPNTPARPTATPRPEATPIPTATPRPQPTPTPTPAWRAATPEEIAARIRENQSNDPPPVAVPTMSPEQIREMMEAGLPRVGGGSTVGTFDPGNAVNMGGVDGEVQRRVYSAWNQPVHLSGASGLRAVGRVTVLRNGTVSGSRILRSSGNPEFDSSVQKALSLVKFAKALPDSYIGDTYTIDITFELAD